MLTFSLDLPRHLCVNEAAELTFFIYSGTEQQNDLRLTVMDL